MPLPPVDDLMLLLAVLEQGSMAAAGRHLGLDASTVSRRIGRLEEDLGMALVQRTGQGVAPSEPGRLLAERVRAARDQIRLGLDEATRTPDVYAGVVRVASPTELGASVVVPLLAPLLEAHPGLELELDLGTRFVNLSHREADIALRTQRPEEGDIVTRRLPPAPLAAWHSPSLPPAVARTRWLTYFRNDPALDRLIASLPDARIVLRSNDLAGLRAAAVAGVGTAVLPTPMARPYDLVPLEGLPEFPAVTIWIAAPATSLELPRVRLVWDTLVGGYTPPDA